MAPANDPAEQAARSKLSSNIQSTVPALKNMADVFKFMGGAAAKSNPIVKETIGGLEKLRRQMMNLSKANSAAKDHVKTLNAAIATEYKKLEQLSISANKSFVNNVAASTSVWNIFGKSIGVGADNMTKKSGNLSAVLSTLIKPSSGAAKALGAIAPTFTKNAHNATNLGAGMLKFNLAAMALMSVFQALMGFAHGLKTTFKGLVGTMGINMATLKNTNALYGSARTAGVMFNVTQGEILEGLGALRQGFVINGMAMKAMGDAAFKHVGASVAEFMGLAKVAGMTAGESQKLAISLVTAGGDIRTLPDQFAKLHTAVVQSGLDTGRLAEAIGMLAPLSTAASNTTEGLLDSFTKFSTIFTTSTNKMLSQANAAKQFTRFASAMQGFTQAAAGLKLPELLAIGGGTQAGTRPGEALQKALNFEGGRPAILMGLIDQMTKDISNPLDKIFAATTYFEQQRGMDALKAADLASLMVERLDRANELDKEGKKEQADDIRKSLQNSSMLLGATENWQDKITGMFESVISLLTGIGAVFIGPRGRVAAAAAKAARSTVQFPMAAGG